MAILAFVCTCSWSGLRERGKGSWVWAEGRKRVSGGESEWEEREKKMQRSGQIAEPANRQMSRNGISGDCLPTPTGKQKP